MQQTGFTTRGQHCLITASVETAVDCLHRGQLTDKCFTQHLLKMSEEQDLNKDPERLETDGTEQISPLLKDVIILS